MAAEKQRIPLDVAQKVLLAFGINQRTREYDGWIRDEDGPAAGFDLEDFTEVLFDAPAVLIVDWRACLPEELGQLVPMLRRLGIELELHVDPQEDAGYISCGGALAAVSYTPQEGPSFDEVIRAVQRIVPPHIHFRSCPWYDGSDSWCYAVLPEKEWAELEFDAPDVINHFFPRPRSFAER